jgi:cobalt-zinc-cadmium efflux system protein
MVAVGGVESVHDLHVWSLSSEVRAMSAHVVLAGHPTLEEAQVVGGHVKASIMKPFRLAHVTLELECEACGPPEDHCAIGPLEGSVGSSNTTVRHEGHHH